MANHCKYCKIIQRPSAKGWVISSGGRVCKPCRDKQKWLLAVKVGDRVHDCLDECVIVTEIDRDLFKTDGRISAHRGMECLSPCDCDQKQELYLSPFTGKYV